MEKLVIERSSKDKLGVHLNGEYTNIEKDVDAILNQIKKIYEKDHLNIMQIGKDLYLTNEKISIQFSDFDGIRKIPNYTEQLKFITDEIDKKFVIENGTIKEVETEKPLKADRTYNPLKAQVVLGVSIIAMSITAGIFIKSNDNIEEYKSNIRYNNNYAYSSITDEQMEAKKIYDQNNKSDYEIFLDNKFLNQYTCFDDKNLSIANDNTSFEADEEKFNITKNNYGNIISKYSHIYGLDENIMLAIATQESGKHTEIENNGGIGLFQIDTKTWINKEITAYNFETQTYETEFITEEKLKNLDFNIKFACMFFQNNLYYSNNNIPVSIQMFNYGMGNMNTIFDYMAKEQNCSIIDFYNNPMNLSWLNYTNIINGGDKERGDDEYLKHVLAYIDKNEILSFKDSDGNAITMPVSYINDEIEKYQIGENKSIKL